MWQYSGYIKYGSTPGHILTIKTMKLKDKLFIAFGIFLAVVIISAITFNLLTVGYHNFARL